MAELSDRARQLLEKQRQKYLSSLNDKHADLMALLNDRENQELELIDAVHRLAGSAGLHGLTSIQQAAVKAEQVLRDSGATRAEQSDGVKAVLSLLLNPA
ncbi:MAG: Hpt domain-containing protein [Lysobacterales bacterium]